MRQAEVAHLGGALSSKGKAEGVKGEGVGEGAARGMAADRAPRTGRG